MDRRIKPGNDGLWPEYKAVFYGSQSCMLDCDRLRLKFHV